LVIVACTAVVGVVTASIAHGQPPGRPFRERPSLQNAKVQTRNTRERGKIAETPPSQPSAAPDETIAPRTQPDPTTATPSGNATNARPGQWALERLELKDGTVYSGLIQARRETEYDFAEIVQPPGRPMYAVVRGVPVELVARVERLAAEDHKQLVDRFTRFRTRSVIEAGRIEQVRLETETHDGVSYRVYRGEWFDLWSTTEEEPTRRCVVRLEQIFRAFRTILPPRTVRGGQLQVYIFGSLAEYESRLDKFGLSIENAAFYSPRERMIVAGSELTTFARRLDDARKQAVATQRQYATYDREFNKGLAVLSSELRAKGFSQEEVNTELSHRKANWKSEMKAVLDRVAQSQRQNEAKFAEVTGQMFARLYHEAFHAYLDYFVFPHDRHHVPRWLNEGLAQIFESGQLEGDLLRIDAPSADRLSALKNDFRSQQRLPLAQLLAANDEPFLVPHGIEPGQADERVYLYAWGLAWHLAFQENHLGTPALDTYLSASAQKLDPAPRFEHLVGKALPEFEKEWRASIERQ
jgi:hypothetical protein